jgi:hypothetical protein
MSRNLDISSRAATRASEIIWSSVRKAEASTIVYRSVLPDAAVMKDSLLWNPFLMERNVSMSGQGED